jgi:hypothetical protein
MRVLLVKPEYTEIVEIGNDLKSLQDAVCGSIEHVAVTDEICMICNEEGKFDGSPFNRMTCGHYMYGNFILCEMDDSGEYTSLDDKIADILMDDLMYLEVMATHRGGEY